MKSTLICVVVLAVSVCLACGSDPENPEVPRPEPDMESDSTNDLSEDHLDQGNLSDTPDLRDEEATEVFEVTVVLEDLANCEEVCGSEDLVCQPVENFLGILVAGTAEYGPGSTTYISRCDRIPNAEEESIDGEIERLTTYTCNCGTSE